MLIGRRETAAPLPSTVDRFDGFLPSRDANEAEADRVLGRTSTAWPAITTLQGASPYRARFRNGASIWPRRFFLVERETLGRLGGNRSAPRVRGRITSLDKMPWSQVYAPVGPVETQFLRQLLLGENIAPFRLLEPVLAVIPVDGHDIMDSAGAAYAGHRHLAAWLRDIETKWAAHAARKTDGSLRMNLTERINHMRGLSAQLSLTGPRVVYTKGGTLISAAIVEDTNILVDQMALWTPARDLIEGQYLSAILNSRTVLDRVIPMQPRGWRDPRHFDKLVWDLRIPDFDAAEPLHRELATAATEAQAAAARVALPDGDYRRKRRAIRDALVELGLAGRIDGLVRRLLDG